MLTYFLSCGVIPELIEVLVTTVLGKERQDKWYTMDVVTLAVSKFLLRAMTGVENCGGPPYGLLL